MSVIWITPPYVRPASESRCSTRNNSSPWADFRRIAGGRFVHNSDFGNTGVPRVALTLLALRGGEFFWNAPALLLRHRIQGAALWKRPSPARLLRSESRSQAGARPRLRGRHSSRISSRGKYVFNATYFNNLFHDQINYVTVNPTTFVGEYFNVNQAFAQGAEVELQAEFAVASAANTAYTYTSTQILDNPAPIDSLYNPGQPLLRRPKHSATTLLSYLGSRWGANLSGSFVGRRPTPISDGFNIDHAAGYVRADLGGWYAINRASQPTRISRTPSTAATTKSSAIPRCLSTSEPDSAFGSEGNKSGKLKEKGNRKRLWGQPGSCTAEARRSA